MQDIRRGRSQPTIANFKFRRKERHYYMAFERFVKSSDSSQIDLPLLIFTIDVSISDSQLLRNELKL